MNKGQEDRIRRMDLMAWQGGTETMRLGVSGIGYQCEEHLGEVLQPWFDLRNRGKHQVFLSLAHGIFPEVYAVSPFDPGGLDGTIASLGAHLSGGRIDGLFISPEPKYEWDLRTCTLPALLKKGIDLLWLLDLQDEIYCVDEILGILDFIENNEKIVWFKVNFKNYVFAADRYVEDFVVPRIWRARIPAEIRCFHYDNSITYEDGQKQEDLEHCTIPRNVAFPKHFSWVGTPEYLKTKIRFQNLHYGICSYKWNEEEDHLEFNEEYYSRYRKKVPEVHRDQDHSSEVNSGD